MERTMIINKFKDLIEKMNSFKKAMVLFQWDNSTGAPKKAIDEKAKIIGQLDTEAYKILTSSEMKKYLDELSNDIDLLDDIDKKLVKIYKKEYDKLMKIPEDEYKAFSILATKSQVAWEEAKIASEFSIFKPYLEQIVDYKRKFITYRGYKDHPYNTLLDDYEPEMTVEKLDEFFNILKKEIVPLLQDIVNSNKSIKKDFIFDTYPIENQKKFSEYLLNLIKYDFDRGMLRESEHPFTLGFSKNDIRVTTHFFENRFLSAIYSTIHEGGHAIYEQNTDDKLIGTTLDEGTSMGIHESQSRFYENIIARSKAFCKVILPKAKELFGVQLNDVTVSQLYEAINIVEPSLIRIESDELTYALHIMVRYELEKKLMNNEIEVKDLPNIWNELMEEYLGIRPNNDAEGVLQDVHWSDGSFGYFPSYALGNAYAAQILATMQKDMDVEDLIEKSDFQSINEWLRKNIHQYGKLLEPNEIIIKATNESLNPKYLVQYLKDKYSNIYNLNK